MISNIIDLNNHLNKFISKSLYTNYHLRLNPWSTCSISIYGDNSMDSLFLITDELYTEVNNNITSAKFYLSDIDDIIKQKIINRSNKLNKIL